MRHMLAIILLACASCGSSREDLPAEAKRVQKEALARAEPGHVLDALGGEILGKDLGEWGGDVVFRENDGSQYQLINDNCRGIFNTPFGVVAVTGLAHGEENRGSVYLLSRQAHGHVTASKTLTLPGWPCKAEATKTGLSLQVFQGYAAAGNPPAAKYDCYLLQSLTDIAPTSCPLVIPEGCFQ
jgi:hypothetical protein